MRDLYRGAQPLCTCVLLVGASLILRSDTCRLLTAHSKLLCEW